MLRAPVVAVLMVGMVGSAWAATLPSAQGEVQAHEHHERILSLQQDDLVQGSWQHSGDVALELFGPDGKVIRHWADAPAQGGPFGFIASTAGEYRLRVLGQGEYQWQVKSVTAPQTPAQAEPLQGDVIRQWSMRLRAGEPARGFWDYVQRVGSPLVERYSNTHDRVTFVWRGARNEVRLHGGPFSYTDRMHRLGESDIWYITYDLPRDARFAYRMAPDVPYVGPSMARDVLRAALQRDPHNPNALPENSKDLFDGESVLRLTQAPAEVVALEPQQLGQGQWRTERLPSEALGVERQVQIYQPAGTRAQEIDHTLILFDGRDYRDLARAPAMLDTLIAQGRVEPMWLVLVDNPGMAERARELPPNEAYIKFLDKELMPWLNAQGVQSTADKTAIGGSSYGGLAAMNAAWRLPQWFGNVLSMSGSFWWAPTGDARGQWLTRQMADSEAVPVKIYMSAGVFESSGSSRDVSLVQANRHLDDVLRARGYDVRYVESATAHDFVAWRDALASGLEHLFGIEQIEEPVQEKK
ncbi:MAG TPA: DUF3327 domain-containing protein [Alcaligenes faecalis]|nr:alpha/beta hydrolase-fold protein [Alcaligenes faecalis]HJE64211.1 DUF3327 domain-containing protein [Alcaligenes faecalis]